jgi:hypothetical protein
LFPMAEQMLGEGESVEMRTRWDRAKAAATME